MKKASQRFTTAVVDTGAKTMLKVRAESSGAARPLRCAAGWETLDCLRRRSLHC